jgi:hypothetical protein
LLILDLKGLLHRIQLFFEEIVLIDNFLDVSDLLPEVILQFADLRGLDHKLLLDPRLIGVEVFELRDEFSGCLGVKDA